jgi:hypothetical protein
MSFKREINPNWQGTGSSPAGTAGEVSWFVPRAGFLAPRRAAEVWRGGTPADGRTKGVGRGIGHA